MKAPDEIFGPVFKAVQLSGVFEDSKTFVDCTPKADPNHILQAFAQLKPVSKEDLRAFVMQYFDVPKIGSADFTADTSRPIRTHIEILWDVLKREADVEVKGSSLIPLPHSYIVPGGRFGEIYYWDSYFTMLGLAVSGRIPLIASMLDNFAYLIKTVGYIPNGNRTYFIGRSQPPFFAQMVNLLQEIAPEYRPYERYLEAMLAEYTFWMSHDDQLPRRLVQLDMEAELNRYWDDRPIPRQESYREDVELAEQTNRPDSEIYRDIRAACESGWDFTSRWLADGTSLSTIETTQILPVDLNCLMYTLEQALSEALTGADRAEEAQHLKTQAKRRKAAIDRFHWDANRNLYGDYHLGRKVPTGVDSLAMVFPLFTGLASQEQADRTAEHLQAFFLKPGGLVTTLHDTGQQWDAPNGWAPLQWVAYSGLRRYGHDALARRCAEHWIENCRRVYLNTGKFVEKYNVADLSLKAGGGEYPVQDGFGWTNGVMLKLMDALQNDN